jgi:hypothetical protein
MTTPFPGESLAIFDAAFGTDHDLLLSVTKRGPYYDVEPPSATIIAGNVWRAWVAPRSADYLDSADVDAEVSWVVEVLSGTVTVAAGEAYDSAWGDDTLAPSRSLGTYSVTGPASLVIPSGFTVAEVFDYLNTPSGDASLMLHLAATAGSADVQQIKMRVWPPGGPLGGLSDPFPKWHEVKTKAALYGTYPDVDKDVLPSSTLTATGSGPTDVDAHANLLDDLVAEAGYAAHDQEVVMGPDVPTFIANLNAYNDTAAHHTVNASLHLVYFPGDRFPQYDNRIDPDGPAVAVGYIRIPTEVSGDPAAYAAVDEDAWWEWDILQYVTVTVETAGDFDAVPLGGWFGTLTGGTFTPDGAVLTRMPALSGERIAPEGVGLSETVGFLVPTSQRDVLFELTPTVVTDPPDFSGIHGGAVGAGQQFDITALTSSLSGFVVHPAYRVWLPAGAPTPQPLRLMQRGDGLGMGSGRVYATGTRQASTRVFGSL